MASRLRWLVLSVFVLSTALNYLDRLLRRVQLVAGVTEVDHIGDPLSIGDLTDPDGVEVTRARALLMVPAQVAFISWHWMLIYPGFLDSLSWHLFGVDGPDFFNNYWSSLASNIVAYSWKMVPFWTLILYAGRIAIPEELYDAAAIDGATGFRRFIHLVIPLLANLYLVCTLLSTIWMIGDFNTVEMVSSGAPNGATDVLATLVAPGWLAPDAIVSVERRSIGGRAAHGHRANDRRHLERGAGQGNQVCRRQPGCLRGTDARTRPFLGGVRYSHDVSRISRAGLCCRGRRCCDIDKALRPRTPHL